VLALNTHQNEHSGLSLLKKKQKKNIYHELIPATKLLTMILYAGSHTSDML